MKLLESEDGLFDNFTPVLKLFKENIEWRKVENDKWIPWPKEGLDEEIDLLLHEIGKLKAVLKEYILQIRKQYDCSKISYAHNRKYVSLLSMSIIEIPIGGAT